MPRSRAVRVLAVITCNHTKSQQGSLVTPDSNDSQLCPEVPTSMGDADAEMGWGGSQIGAAAPYRPAAAPAAEANGASRVERQRSGGLPKPIRAGSGNLSLD